METGIAQDGGCWVQAGGEEGVRAGMLTSLLLCRPPSRGID